MPFICNDNNNGCYAGPYYPRPIFNCGNVGSCGGSNTIINPVRSEEWGFFVGDNSSIEENEVIPLSLSSSAGTAVSQTSANSINLTTGSYQINFNVTASSDTEPMQFAVYLNEVKLPFSALTGVGNGSVQSLSNSFIITVPSNSILKAVNLTAGNVNIVISSLAVTKLLT